MSNETSALQAFIDQSAAFQSATGTAITDLQKRVAALEVPIVPPIITPPYDPKVQWHAGMESGHLLASNGGDWDIETVTGSANSAAVQATAENIPPHGGLWVMKQAVTGPVGGTRMGRYLETNALVQAGTPFYVTWWDYYPAQIRFGSADMFSYFQIAGVDANLSYNPVWMFLVNGTDFTPVLMWSPNLMAPAEGPHAGESGKRAYTSTTPIPVGRWVKFEVFIKPAADFTGAVKLWMDGAVIFDEQMVKTRYPGSGAPSVPGFMYVTHNAYGSGLTPTPTGHYVDDVTYSLGRMP
jgi:hypothetical protein